MSTPGGPIRRIEALPEWMTDALCAQVSDPDRFYPRPNAGARDAKEICRQCRVRPQCLAYAVDNAEDHGIWGGLTEKQRRHLRRRTPTTTHPEGARP